MQIQLCTPADCAVLAALNKQLIEDEQHENSMDPAQLEMRMLQFITSDYDAYLFRNDGQTVGYALVCKTANPLYLRQFLICRAQRRKGYGSEAFRLLYAYLHTDRLDLDVLVWNERAVAFYQSLGFKPRFIRMRYERGND